MTNEEIPIHTASPQPPPPHCRHRGGEEDCQPECMLIFGEMYEERKSDIFDRIQRNNYPDGKPRFE